MFYYQNEMLAKQRLADTERKSANAWMFHSIRNKMSTLPSQTVTKNDAQMCCTPRPCATC